MEVPLPSPPTPDEDRRYLEQVIEQSRAAMHHLREANRLIGEAEGTGEAAQGLIRATADGRGGLIKISVNPRALRLDTRTLGAEVTRAVQAAQEHAGQVTGEIVEGALTRAGGLPAPLDETFVRDRIELAASDLYSERA